MKKLYYLRHDIMFICDSDEDRWKAAQRFLKEQVIDGRIGDDIEEITDIF